MTTTASSSPKGRTRRMYRFLPLTAFPPSKPRNGTGTETVALTDCESEIPARRMLRIASAHMADRPAQQAVQFLDQVRLRQGQ
ncbi:hypothetical protein HCC61_22995 [Streptomyces sp. HNM0575]|uniref:hypothetical protein n=1 Tax=Streptomyces sp. HNM0575 TaxID=2716338 RepID=UPI00145D891C|nr:hypothetical protein [Streptomyces sp. HNM0575]NLU75497.1 hypothetical protein [Streptomyces sp. HNM0575]